MSTTPNATADKAKNVRLYDVHKSIRWKGTRISPGSSLALTTADLDATEVRAWLEHGWITVYEPGQTKSKASQAEVNSLAYVVLSPMMWNGFEKQPGNKIQGAIVGAGELIRSLLEKGSMREMNDAEYARSRAQRATISQPVAVGKVTPVPAKKAAAPPIPQTVSGELVQAIPCKRIQKSPYNPRKDFSTPAAVAAMEELVDSVREQGIIQPLIVRPLPVAKEEEAYYELIAGERRWTAAQRLDLQTVPCLVRDIPKQQAIEQQALENLQRRDLNQVEEGEGYRTLMNEGGLTVPQIMRKTGKSEATIYSRLKLLECPPGIRKAVVEGRLPGSTADLVAREENSDFRAACMDAILFPVIGSEADEGGGNVLSFRAAKAWINTNRAPFLAEAEWKKRQRDSHAFKGAAAVLSVEASAEAVYAGGEVRATQDYVKPTDKCFADPKGRTYEELATEAGVDLPKPVLARDPQAGAPVVLLPREATEKVLVRIVPAAEEQRHQRAAADLRRKLDLAEADRVRKEAREKRTQRATAVQRVCGACAWDAEQEEAFLRYLVGDRLRRLLGDGVDELQDVLKQFGLELVVEDRNILDADWIRDYLAGTEAGRLRSWLLYFHLREADAYVENRTSPDTIDEDRLLGAEMAFSQQRMAFPQTEPEPRTSAVGGEAAK